MAILMARPRDEFDRVTPTTEERAAYAAANRFRPSVYRLQCRTCGARIWGSGLGIGSHLRSRAHLRPGLLRQAAIMDERGQEAESVTDREWYRREADRLREVAG